MNENLKKDIVASLFTIPCSLDELCKREFLKTYSKIGIDRILMSMENKKMIFFRGNKYYAYKKYALSREMSEYDLVDPKAMFKRQTIEEAVSSWNKKKSK